MTIKKIYCDLDEQLKDFNRNDFLALIEESRSYCAQDLRTSLDIIDVNRLPELSRKLFVDFLLRISQKFLCRTSINSIGSSCIASLSYPSCSFNFTQFRNWSLSKCKELSSRRFGNLSLSSCEKMVGKREYTFQQCSFLLFSLCNSLQIISVFRTSTEIVSICSML